MSAPIFRTKGELRSKLLIKLGYGGLGAAAGNFVPMADELLEEAQSVLYNLMPDEKRIRTWDFYTEVDTKWYEFPDDCDPDRIMNLSVYYGDQWLPIKRGIGRPEDSNYDRVQHYPYRYDFRALADTPTELQSNADFDIEDITATGGNTGWSWLTGQWVISGGRAYPLSATGQYIWSDDPVEIGTQYTITYLIDGDDPGLSAQFGGITTDIDGETLPVTIGEHTVVVEAVTTEGFRYSNGTGTSWLESVNVHANDDTSKPVHLELYPTDDTDQHLCRIEGYIQLMPFVQDADRATIDDMLILLYAEAYGKAHLNKPDAQAKMLVLKERLKILRGEQHGEQRYIRGEKEEATIPIPRVV